MVEAQDTFIDHQWLVYTAPNDQTDRVPYLNFMSRGRLWDLGERAIFPVFELSTSCLLDFALETAEQMMPGAKRLAPRLQEVIEANLPTSATPRLLYVFDAETSHDVPNYSFFLVSNQKPLEGIIDLFFDLSNGARLHRSHTTEMRAGIAKWAELVRSFRKDAATLKKIPRKKITLDWLRTHQKNDAIHYDRFQGLPSLSKIDYKIFSYIVDFY